jgi:hypothetical protein
LIRVVATEMAGPILIVCSVLIVLARFALGGKATTQHFDLLPLWLPTHCFLGSSLAAGNVPAWNPFAMGGTPFAASPQSGWLYLPAIVLYSTLPCARALGWFIAIQPMIAGVGIYSLLRSEGVARPAAAVGGVCLSLSMAGSFTAISLPFSGAVGWSTVCLATTSRLWRATTGRRRILWALATALAWGQLASAHMSHGLFVGTVAMLVYLIARFVADFDRHSGWVRQRLVAVVLLALTLPIVNVAIFLPRLELIHTSSLRGGYQLAGVTAARLQGFPPPAPPIGSTGEKETRWPLGMALTPGAYVGIAAVALVAAGLWSRRHRPLAVGFILFALVSYLLSLRSVAEFLAPHVRGFSLGDFYLHAPGRARYGVILAAPILAGLGADAWLDRRRWTNRVAMLVPGLLVFGALPTLLGYRWGGQWIPLGGAIVGTVVLALSAARPRLLLVLSVALGIELTVNGLAGQADLVHPSKPPGGFQVPALARLMRPDIDLAAYLRPDRFVRAIAAGGPGRYLPLARAGKGPLNEGGFTHPRGYLSMSTPTFWPLLANERSTLFRIEDVGGSDEPVQLWRYWAYVRAVDSAPVKYNAAFLTPPSGTTLDLLQVRWVISRASRSAPSGRTVLVARQGPWNLYELTEAPPRVSVVPSWRVVPSPGDALRAVTDPGFDVERQAILESPPRFPVLPRGSTVRSATGSFRWNGPQAAEIRVASPRPAIVMIRNTYAPGWSATVDGTPVHLQPVDYLDQGVPIPPGGHTIELTYDDPAVGQGLIGSGVAIALLLAVAALQTGRPRPAGRVRTSARDEKPLSAVEARETGSLGRTRR